MGIHGLGQSLSRAHEGWQNHKHLMKQGIGKSAVLQILFVDAEAACLEKAGDENETQKTVPSNSLQIKSDTEKSSIDRHNPQQGLKYN
jgi:hypothetical protein